MSIVNVKDTTGKSNKHYKNGKPQWKVFIDTIKKHGKASETKLGIAGIHHVSNTFLQAKRKGYDVRFREKVLSTNPFNPNKSVERVYYLES